MVESISRRTDTNAEWNTGILTDVVAVNDGLELVNNCFESFESDFGNFYANFTAGGSYSLSSEQSRDGEFSLKITKDSSSDNISMMNDTDLFGYYEIWVYVSGNNSDWHLLGVSSMTIQFAKRDISNTNFAYEDTRVHSSAQDTGIIQTQGWHKLVIDNSDNTLEVSIDNKVVYSADKLSSENSVHFSSYWNASAGDVLYFDNFFCGYSLQGTRQSPQIDLPTAGTLDTSSISWESTEGSTEGGIEGLSFDGVDDYVDCGLCADLDQTSFTIEGWFLGKDVANKFVLIGKHNTLGDNESLHFGILVRAGFPVCATLAFNGDDVSSNIEIQNDTWYHIAGTFDYSTLEQKIYVNGNFENSRIASNGLLNTNSQSLLIMKARGAIRGPANMRKVRIWSDVRTQTEIANNMDTTLDGTEAGLVWASPIDTGSGTEIVDIVNGNNGTIIGATWLSDIAPLTIETSVAIETSVDNKSTWQIATNGSNILNLTDTSTTLDVRQTLSTTNIAITPRLLNLYLEVIFSEIVNYGGLITLKGNLYWEPRNSPIFKDSGLLNLEGNMYWESRSSPIFKGGIDRVIRVKFIPVIWMTAMGEIKQWNTEAKPANDWQSVTKPNNTWEG